MKRYNIHLDPEWMKALDEICEKIAGYDTGSYCFWGISRAELIRFAVGHCFGLEQEYPRFNKEELWKAIKRALKKRQGPKGV